RQTISKRDWISDVCSSDLAYGRVLHVRREAADGDLRAGGLVQQHQVVRTVDVVDLGVHGRELDRVLRERQRREKADRKGKREQLHPPVAEDPAHFSHPSRGRTRRPLTPRGAGRPPVSRLRRPSPSRLRVILPSSTTEIAPVSSEITTVKASEASESPMAARWRGPSRSRTAPSSGSGSRHPASTTRSARMITAPS